MRNAFLCTLSFKKSVDPHPKLQEAHEVSSPLLVTLQCSHSSSYAAREYYFLSMKLTPYNENLARPSPRSVMSSRTCQRATICKCESTEQQILLTRSYKTIITSKNIEN
uniref:Ovule protein n=1 Tax=Ascaris lumbricoides TaxID=6252 RepID=A0A0M3I9G5_ASCLU